MEDPNNQGYQGQNPSQAQDPAQSQPAGQEHSQNPQQQSQPQQGAGQPVQTYNQEPQTNTMAIVGFILSIFIAPAGLIVSIIAYNNLKNDPKQGGKGLAVAGIVIGAIITAIPIILVILWILAFASFFHAVSDATQNMQICSGPSEMPCMNAPQINLQEDTVSFEVKNNVGADIVLQSLLAPESTRDSQCLDSNQIPLVNAEYDQQSVSLGSAGTLDVPDSRRVKLTVHCSKDLTEDTRISERFQINYFHNGLTKSSLVTVKANTANQAGP